MTDFEEHWVKIEPPHIPTITHDEFGHIWVSQDDRLVFTFNGLTFKKCQRCDSTYDRLAFFYGSNLPICDEIIVRKVELRLTGNEA